MADIEFVLQHRGLVTRARLLDDLAPETCRALWEMLPIEAPTIHAQSSGNELYCVFPWNTPPPFRENHTNHVQAGDVFFYYSPWYHQSAKPGGEIAIYYDHDAHPLGGMGLMAGTLFAVIEEDLPSFAQACENIWRDGTDRLIVRRGSAKGARFLTSDKPGESSRYSATQSPPRYSSPVASFDVVRTGPSTPIASADSAPLRLTVLGTDVSVNVQMLDDVAPETCAAIRQVLPLEAPTYHGKRGGSTVFLPLPPFDFPVHENPVWQLTAGDLVAFRFPPLYRGSPIDRPDLKDTGYTQITLCYRDGATPTGPEGPIAGTRFGHVIGDATALFDACAKSKASGQLRFRLS